MLLNSMGEQEYREASLIAKDRMGRNRWASKTPLLSKGGVDATQEIVAQRPYRERTGWLVQAPKQFLGQHHPVCAVKEASRHFLRDAATPPPLRRGV
jgi:hypothetical protein